MAKKRLTQLADEYGLTLEKAQEIIQFQFEESMVSGKGKNTWINKEGQALFEELVPLDIIYRGRVLRPAPNSRYVIAYVKELTQKIAVQIPLKLKGNLTNKIIHIQADNTAEEPKYHWIPTPRK
jgi:hypothetical protein